MSRGFLMGEKGLKIVSLKGLSSAYDSGVPIRFLKAAYTGHQMRFLKDIDFFNKIN